MFGNGEEGMSDRHVLDVEKPILFDNGWGLIEAFPGDRIMFGTGQGPAFHFISSEQGVPAFDKA